MTGINNLISPISVAAWLVAKTSLTFEQIAKSTGLNLKEVELIADGSYFYTAVPLNPIQMNIFKKEDIEKAEKNPSLILKPTTIELPTSIIKKVEKSRNKKPHSLKKHIQNCVAYIVQVVETENNIQFTDTEIAKLLGSTKNTVAATREQIAKKEVKIFKVDPVSIGLCNKEQLDKLIKKHKNKSKK